MTTNKLTTTMFLLMEALLSSACFLYDFRLRCKRKIQNEIHNPHLFFTIPSEIKKSEIEGLIFLEIWNIKIHMEIKEETHVY